MHCDLVMLLRHDRRTVKYQSWVSLTISRHHSPILYTSWLVQVFSYFIRWVVTIISRWSVYSWVTIFIVEHWEVHLACVQAQWQPKLNNKQGGNKGAGTMGPPGWHQRVSYCFDCVRRQRRQPSFGTQPDLSCEPHEIKLLWPPQLKPLPRRGYLYLYGDDQNIKVWGCESWFGFVRVYLTSFKFILCHECVFFSNVRSKQTSGLVLRFERDKAWHT